MENTKVKQNLINAGIILCTGFLLLLALISFFNGLDILVQIKALDLPIVYISVITSFFIFAIVIVEIILISINFIKKDRQNCNKIKKVIFSIAIISIVLIFVALISSLILIYNQTINYNILSSKDVSNLAKDIITTSLITIESSMRTIYIITISLFVFLSVLVGLITFEKNTTLFDNQIQTQNDELENEEVSKITSSKNRSLKNLLFIPMSICSFIFIAFISVFSICMLDNNKYIEPKYDFSYSKLREGYHSSYYVEFELEYLYNNTNHKKTLSIKCVCLVDGNYEEVIKEEEINANSYNYSSGRAFRFYYTNDYAFVGLYYLNDDGEYVELPEYENKTYNFGNKEIVFLTMSCISFVGVITCLTAYIILLIKEKLRKSKIKELTENENAKS